MQVFRTAADLAASPMGDPRSVVMTMGALHAGHASLFTQARDRVGPTGTVLATIFVNPLQFAANEDFDRYPRTIDADLEICADHGVDGVFLPEVADIYPPGAVVTVDPGPLGLTLEGASRPGHFTGVLTVVNKLLNLTRADFALFGEKDYQQLILIQQMVADLFMPVTIVAAPTVRESDGLAMSSRNRFLTAEQRQRAVAVPRALRAAAAHAAEGPEAAEAAGLAVLAEAAGLEVDYFTVRGLDLGEPSPGAPGRILAAVRIGETRLIDNMACDVGPA